MISGPFPLVFASKEPPHLEIELAVTAISHAAAHHDGPEKGLYQYGGGYVHRETRFIVAGKGILIGLADFIAADEIDVISQEGRQLRQTVNITGLDQEILVAEELIRA